MNDKKLKVQVFMGYIMGFRNKNKKCKRKSFNIKMNYF